MPETYDGPEVVTPDCDAPTTAQEFGEGEMPPRLATFNWGAFFLPPIWGMVYGAPMIVGLWAIALLMSPLLLALVGSTRPEVVFGAIVASQVFSAATRLWSGMNGNRFAWRQQRIRREVIGLPSRFSEAQFTARQKRWGRVGAVLTIGAVLLLAGMLYSYDVSGITQPAGAEITWLDVELGAAWTFAEIALAAWLARKMREEVPACD